MRVNAKNMSRFLSLWRGGRVLCPSVWRESYCPDSF